jgi:hypothetical protein
LSSFRTSAFTQPITTQVCLSHRVGKEEEEEEEEEVDHKQVQEELDADS